MGWLAVCSVLVLGFKCFLVLWGKWGAGIGLSVLLAPGFFVEQNRILWVTLPIKLGIPDTPEVLVLSIAPDR